jgi:fucose permease
VTLTQGVRLLSDRALLLIAFTLALQSGIEGVINNWTTTYLQGPRGIEPAAALLALSAYVAGMTGARMALAGVLKAAPAGPVLTGGLALAALGLSVVAWAPNAGVAAAGLVLVGAGLAAGFPLLIGYVVELHPTVSGTAISVVLTIALPGNMALNYVMGIIADWAGVGALPVYLGVTLALELVLMALALRAFAARRGHAPPQGPSGSAA